MCIMTQTGVSCLQLFTNTQAIEPIIKSSCATMSDRKALATKGHEPYLKLEKSDLNTALVKLKQKGSW